MTFRLFGAAFEVIFSFGGGDGGFCLVGVSSCRLAGP